MAIATDKIDFNFFIDNTKTISLHELNTIKNIINKLKWEISKKAFGSRVHFLGPNGADDVARHMPDQTLQIVDGLFPRGVGQLLTPFYKVLEEYLQDVPPRPRSIIYFTNGYDLANGPDDQEKLKAAILTAMFLGLQIRIMFVQVGNVAGAQDVFEKLDNGLMDEFEDRLKNDNDTSLRLCMSAQNDGEKAHKYKNHYDIVDHVRLGSADDVDEQMIQKIVIGALNPNQG
ncbi:hypothetical protein PGQ11_009308 [Apiospora arundinis]|uniref:VWFA domain-containing protein n=1 Tax=Apiospora arundinis TaxID=335852 RepID=A0ABR2IHM7_9PEZI